MDKHKERQHQKDKKYLNDKKNFKCKNCEKAYTKINNLNAHVRRVHQKSSW